MVEGAEVVEVATVETVCWLKSLCAPDADRDDGTDPTRPCSSDELVTTTGGWAVSATGTRGVGVAELSRVLAAGVEDEGSTFVDDGRRWRSKSVWNGTVSRLKLWGPLRRNQSMTCFALPFPFPLLDAFGPVAALPQVASNSGRTLEPDECGGEGRAMRDMVGGRGLEVGVAVEGRPPAFCWVMVLERVRDVGECCTVSSLGVLDSLAGAGARVNPPMLSAFCRRLFRRMLATALALAWAFARVSSSCAFSSATRFASTWAADVEGERSRLVDEAPRRPRKEKRSVESGPFLCLLALTVDATEGGRVDSAAIAVAGVREGTSGTGVD